MTATLPSRACAMAIVRREWRKLERLSQPLDNQLRKLGRKNSVDAAFGQFR